MSKSVNIGVTSTHDDSGLSAAKRSTDDLIGRTDRTSLSQRDLTRATAGTNVALIALQRIASGDVVGGIRMSIEALSSKLGSFGIRLAGAAAAFSAGWQVGTWIRDITGLGNALDKLLAPATNAKASITTLANARLTSLRSELDGVRNSLTESAKNATELIAHLDSISKARLANQQLAQVDAARGASPSNAPVIAAAAALDNARVTPEQREGVGRLDDVAREAKTNVQKMEQDLSDARKKLALADYTYRYMKEGGVRDESEILNAAIARNTIEELQRQLPGARDAEEKAADNARNAHTNLTKALIEETKARDALHAAVKKQNDDREATLAATQATAAKKESDARAQRESAQFANETPERQLNYLRNKARQINAELRGDNGPINQAVRDQLEAEKETLRARYNAILKQQTKTTVPGVPAVPVPPKATTLSSASTEDVLTALADAPRRQSPGLGALNMGRLANMNGIIGGDIKRFSDSRFSAAVMSPGGAPRDKVADNTAKSAESLQRIEKLLTTPRR
jgi:hypothetical protein